MNTMQNGLLILRRIITAPELNESLRVEILRFLETHVSENYAEIAKMVLVDTHTDLGVMNVPREAHSNALYLRKTDPGNKINAIKKMREDTGFGLREAKVVIDAMWAEAGR